MIIFQAPKRLGLWLRKTYFNSFHQSEIQRESIRTLAQRVFLAYNLFALRSKHEGARQTDFALRPSPEDP